MATTLTEMLDWLERTLEPGRFRDYCPNGLQVEGRSTVARLATGVTASQALLDAAIEWGADAILVHHGYFWKGEPEVVVGMKRRRLATLLQAEVSLLAYHLPLDAHPALGNNACLGDLLGVTAMHPLDPQDSESVGSLGRLPGPVAMSDLLRHIEAFTGRQALHVGDQERQVQTLAWCTGAAQGYIDRAALAGADVYITGEASEQTVHSAREQRIEFVAAGHHATERYGVQAVGEALADALGVEHRFIDIDNPV